MYTIDSLSKVKSTNVDYSQDYRWLIMKIIYRLYIEYSQYYRWNIDGL